jgi:molybdopterin converting factor small subunit
MAECKDNEIAVTVNYRGLWDIPFITKKNETLCLPAGSTVESLMNSLAAKHGEEFKKIIPFCNPVIQGRMITPYERASTTLKDGEWITFVFGIDGG